MPTSTLSDLRTRVRQKADIEGATDRHTDTELNGYINRAHSKLYGKLATLQLLKQQKTTTITATGAAVYQLASDFYATYGVFEQVDGTYFRRLHIHGGHEKPFGIAAHEGVACTYAIASVDNSGLEHQIEFSPNPQSGTYIVKYVPELSDLSGDSDTTFDIPLNWDDFIVYDAAMMVLEKDDLPFGQIAARKQELEVEIEQAAASRELLESYRIRDVRGANHEDAADQFPYQLPWMRAPWW